MIGRIVALPVRAADTSLSAPPRPKRTMATPALSSGVAIPPRTSKWNRIEPRLFSYISPN